MKKIFNNKFLNFLVSFIETIICIFLFCLVVITGFQRIKGSFFGYRVYTVASASMIPNYNVGDVLLVKRVDIKTIEVGDAVTYIGEAKSVKDMIITHRVEKIEKNKDGKLLFHTKGIANNIEDPIVSGDQIIGKVIYKFYTLSMIGGITTSPFRIFFFLTVPIAILISIEIIKTIKSKDDDDEEEDEEEVKKDKIEAIQKEKVIEEKTEPTTESDNEKKPEEEENTESTTDSDKEKEETEKDIQETDTDKETEKVSDENEESDNKEIKDN